MTIELHKPPRQFNPETASKTSHNIITIFLVWLRKTGYIWWIWAAGLDRSYGERIATEFSCWFAREAKTEFDFKRMQEAARRRKS